MAFSIMVMIPMTLSAAWVTVATFCAPLMHNVHEFAEKPGLRVRLGGFCTGEFRGVAGRGLDRTAIDGRRQFI